MDPQAPDIIFFLKMIHVLPYLIIYEYNQVGFGGFFKEKYVLGI